MSRRLEKHEIQVTEDRVVGVGANSVVTAGTCCGGSVAIKTFKGVDLQSLRREAAHMQELMDSPNIVRLFGWCEEPACLVMQYFPLGSLRQVLCSSLRTLHAQRISMPLRPEHTHYGNVRTLDRSCNFVDAKITQISSSCNFLPEAILNSFRCWRVKTNTRRHSPNGQRSSAV